MFRQYVVVDPKLMKISLLRRTFPLSSWNIDVNVAVVSSWMQVPGQVMFTDLLSASILNDYYILFAQMQVTSGVISFTHFLENKGFFKC